MTAYGIPLPARMKRTFTDLPAVVRDALQLIVVASYNKNTGKSTVIFGVYVDISQ